MAKNSIPRRRPTTTGRPHLGLGETGEPWVKKQPNGRYSAGVWMRDASGRRRQVTASGDTIRDARRTLEDKIATSQVAPPQGVQPTWTAKTLLDHWLPLKIKQGHQRRRASLRPQTVADYTRIVKRMLIPALGHYRVHELTAPVVENVLLDIEQSGATSAGARRVLNQALNLAVRDGALPYNPLTLIPGTPRDFDEVDALDLEQARHLLHLAHPDNKQGQGRRPNRDLYDFVIIALGTGARISEILAIRRVDVRDDDGNLTVSINGTMVEPKKGYIDAHTRQEGTKTGRDRTLLVPTAAADLIRERLNSAPDKNLEAPLLQSAKGNALWAANLRTRLRNVVKNDPDLAGTTPHTLRRTVGTHLAYEVGVDAARLQLGHSITGATPLARYVRHRTQVADHRSHLDAFFTNLDDTTSSA